MEKMENENRRTSAGAFACIYFEIKNGETRIRTLEGGANRFTVCPL